MNPIPASRMQCPICSGLRSILTPRAASTSAAPERDDSARLPCLATGTPAPATISAAQVEILNEPEASPPVPTRSMASGGASTRSILARIVVTAPVISSTVSPRSSNRINSAPLCDGVASPDIICSKAPADSSRLSAAPVATLPISALNSAVTASSSMELRGAAPSGRIIPTRGNVEKVFQQEMAMVRRDALGMKLYAVHRQAAMREPHDKTVIGIGGHREFAWHAVALDHERVVTRRLEGGIDAAK